jgi:hypothetical protein
LRALDDDKPLTAKPSGPSRAHGRERDGAGLQVREALVTRLREFPGRWSPGVIFDREDTWTRN